MSRIPVTSGLIAACMLVYLGVSALGTSAGLPWNAALVEQPIEILYLGAMVPALVAQEEAWRLLTSIFLHSGATHLAFNMISLYFLGPFTELTFGRARYFALYLTGGFAGGIAYLYFGGFDTPAVGASGAIFGIVGGILGFARRRGSFAWRSPVVRQLLILTAINLFLGATIPNVSNTAHIGGLAGGFLYGWLMAPTIRSRKPAVIARPVIIVLGLEAALLAAWLIYA